MYTAGSLWTTHRTPIKVEQCSILSKPELSSSILVTFPKCNFIDYSNEFYVSVSISDDWIPSLVIGVTSSISQVGAKDDIEILGALLPNIMTLDKLHKVFMANGGQDYRKWFR